MEPDLNVSINRQNTLSTKWRHYEPDVLPFWVADMDFKSPAAVLEAIQQRVNHGVFGYEIKPFELKEEIVRWFYKRYKWQIDTDAIIFIPGVVPGFNWAVRRFLKPADALLVQPPVYGPILNSAQLCGVQGRTNPLSRLSDGTYTIDFSNFESEMQKNTKMFLLCNPHNPVGRVYLRHELEKMASICLRHDVIICSDEIHGDLIFNNHHHIPIGSISPEIAHQTITLHAPSKTFNIAGLKCAYAVIPNPELRKQFTYAIDDLLGSVNILGYTAALAAYRSGEPWLENLLGYLEHNRDVLTNYINQHIPGISVVRPEGTYLAWLDCSALQLNCSPYQFFLEHARIAMNDGPIFGPGGEHFVRFNFGCPTPMLLEGLQRMQIALEKR